MTDEQDDLPPSYYGPTSPVAEPKAPGPDDDIPFPSPEVTTPVVEPTPVDASTVPEKPEWPETVKFTIEVESETLGFLAIMAAEGGDTIERASATLQDFFDHVHMGIRNRGVWQRGWLVRAFSDAWIDRLEVDPEDPAHMRIKVAKVEG